MAAGRELPNWSYGLLEEPANPYHLQRAGGILPSPHSLHILRSSVTASCWLHAARSQGQRAEWSKGGSREARSKVMVVEMERGQFGDKCNRASYLSGFEVER